MNSISSISSSSRQIILLTGASGVVGQALLAKLQAHCVICLTHATPVNTSGITTISGDIARPHLGIPKSQYQDIAKRIDCIIHAAAITDFSQPSELIERTNVGGLKNMLELAAIAQVPIHYISTAFIKAYQRTQQGENMYTISKRQGEKLVRESGLKSTIIRPSIIIGDSRTGHIARFQGIYQVISSWLRGLLPLVPMLPQAYIDFIPQDIVASAIAALVEQNCTGEFWLTSGSQALTVNKIANLVVEFARNRELMVDFPQFVNPDFLERLNCPEFVPALPKPAIKGFNWFRQVSPYLSNVVPFPSCLPEINARYNLPSLPKLETAFMRSLDYWANQTRLQPRLGDRYSSF